MRTEIQSIIRQLRDIQHTRNWVGANFDHRLEFVKEDNAFLHPLPDLHSAAQLLAHLTAWRNDAMLKLKTGSGKLTEGDEENWPPDEKLKALGWKKIRADHDESLEKLIQLLEDKDDTFLESKYYDPDFKSDQSDRYLVEGLLHHDIYHLGQLGIVVKYLRQG